jgi:hypothetical protein
MNYLVGSIGLFVLAIGLVWLKINTPEGGHRRPPWWQRIRERRLEERAQNAVTVRLFEDISNGLRGEATRAATSPMPRPERPLKPLPPGAEEYADHFHRPLPPEYLAELRERPGEAMTGGYRADIVPEHRLDGHERCRAIGFPTHPGPCQPVAPRAEDPLGVATPGQVADELAGDPQKLRDRAKDDAPVTSLPAPEPDPVVLTDYRVQTGSWEALVDAVMPKDGE